MDTSTGYHNRMKTGLSLSSFCKLLGVIMMATGWQCFATGSAFAQPLPRAIDRPPYVLPPIIQPRISRSPAAQQPADTKPAQRFDIEKRGAIVYHTGDTYLLKCDLYQPIPKTPSKQKRPVVVMIHGGAWRTGSKFSMLRHARRLTRVGYAVMSINYRLAPKYPWPAQIEDCRMALDWLNKNADQYNLDTHRVGVFGYSAGAQLAALLAATNEQNPNVKIRAAAVGGTPAEFSWIEDDSTALVYWLGSTKQEDDAVYRDASPTHFITANDPPFFIFHGTTDWLVPIQSARQLDRKLRQTGVDSKLIEVPDSGHFGTFSKIELMQDVIKFFDKNLAAVTTER